MDLAIKLNRHEKTFFAVARGMLFLAVFVTGQTYAGSQIVDEAGIQSVVVNGGTDTTNPGTTCIRLTTGGVAACSSGWIGIPNNNKALLTTALMIKSSGVKAWVYYDDSAPSQHCPGVVFTPCALNSIMLK